MELAAVAARTDDGRRPVFGRVILKLGGEALLGTAGYGIDYGAARHIAEQVTHIVERGVQVAIVVGGGNIYRGLAAVNIGGVVISLAFSLVLIPALMRLAGRERRAVPVAAPAAAT